MNLVSAYEDAVSKKNNETAETLNYDQEYLKNDSVRPSYFTVVMPRFYSAVQLSAEEKDVVLQFISLINPELWKEGNSIISLEDIKVDNIYSHESCRVAGYFELLFQYLWPDKSAHLIICHNNIRFGRREGGNESPFPPTAKRVDFKDIPGFTQKAKIRNCKEEVDNAYKDYFSNFLMNAIPCQEYMIFTYYRYDGEDYDAMLFKDGNLYLSSNRNNIDKLHVFLNTESLLVDELDKLNNKGIVPKVFY